MAHSLKHAGMPALATLEPVATDASCFTLRIAGDWSLAGGFPSAEKTMASALSAESAGGRTRLLFDCSALGNHDSSLPAFLLALHRLCEPQGIVHDNATLPTDVARLLALTTGKSAASEPLPEAVAVCGRRRAFLQRVGEWSIGCAASWHKALDFIGQVAIAFWNLLRGRARTRVDQCMILIQANGAEALPVVSLISFLTGLILAYIGVLQMRQVGAVNYVPGMVALTMLREMGVLMAGVILCGRTATAYAAQLASMNVSEEISALRVLGISPVEYLVLPRMLALLFMMPLLTLYADFCGIAGSLLVTSSMGLSIEQTFEMMARSFGKYGFGTSLASGLIKSVCFSVLISWSGCFRGMVSGKSSQAVGDATTSAAVLGITLLVVADAVFSVLFNAIDFF